MSDTVEVPCQWCWNPERGESTGMNPLDPPYACGHCEGQRHIRVNPEDVATELSACPHNATMEVSDGKAQ